MNLLSRFKGRKVIINPGNDQLSVIAKIEEVDNYGVLLEVLDSPKPYLTGYEVGSLHYVSNSTPTQIRILEEDEE